MCWFRLPPRNSHYSRFADEKSPSKSYDEVTLRRVPGECFGFLGRFLAKLASFFYNWAARNLFLSTIATGEYVLEIHEHVYGLVRHEIGV